MSTIMWRLAIFALNTRMRASLYPRRLWGSAKEISKVRRWRKPKSGELFDFLVNGPPQRGLVEAVIVNSLFIGAGLALAILLIVNRGADWR